MITCHVNEGSIACILGFQFGRLWANGSLSTRALPRPPSCANLASTTNLHGERAWLHEHISQLTPRLVCPRRSRRIGSSQHFFIRSLTGEPLAIRQKILALLSKEKTSKISYNPAR